MLVVTIFGALSCMAEESILRSNGKTMVMLEGPDMRLGPFYRPEALVSGTQCL